MAIGSYLTFLLFVLGTMSDDFMNDEERKRFYQEILISHNGYRFWHYARALKLDQNMCNTLKEHADMLVANKKSQIPEEYGVNILKLVIEDKPILLANGIVSLWYSYGQDYDYGTEPLSPSEDIDAFTQVIWNSTKYIGVGTWIKDNTFHIAVAYSPKGNITGQYENNVIRPRQKPK